MLCVGMLPMQANGADTLLAFAPYAFATERHGTINAQVAFLEVDAGGTLFHPAIQTRHAPSPE